MLRKYPNIKGLLDRNVENELKATFDILYDTIEMLANKANISLELNVSQQPSATTIITKSRNGNAANSPTGLDKGTFAQPVLGVGSDPNMKTAIPDDVVHTDAKVTAGAVPVGGFVTITDGFGHLIQVLTK